MKRGLLVLSLLAISSQHLANAQNVPPALSKVSAALECLRKEGMKGWERERVQPIAGSKNVLVDVWASAGRRVKVSVLYYDSEVAAAESMRRLAADGLARKVPGLGDEAYASGYSGQIALRRGNLTAFVGAITDIDLLLPSVEDKERSELKRAEEVALNKHFAKIMSNVLADPLATCPKRIRD